MLSSYVNFTLDPKKPAKWGVVNIDRTDVIQVYSEAALAENEKEKNV